MEETLTDFGGPLAAVISPIMISPRASRNKSTGVEGDWVSTSVGLIVLRFAERGSTSKITREPSLLVYTVEGPGTFPIEPPK